MSMEALLDEENKEVLAALDRDIRRSSSPGVKFKPTRTATPPPLFRSMLDVDSPPIRRSSIASIPGLTSPTASRKSGKELDPNDPSSWTSPHSSKPNSPVFTKASPVITRQRHSSETEPPAGLPKIQTDDKQDFEQNYQFDIAPVPTSGPASRSPTDSKRPREGSTSAMAAALSGDLGSLHVGLPSGKPTATAVNQSRSPSSRNRKPDAPNSGLLSPTPPSAPLTTQSGTLVDGQAHSRLTQTKSGSMSANSENSEGLGRVTKDDVDGGEEEAVDTDDAVSSDEDDSRGRSEKRKLSANGTAPKVSSPDSNSTSSPEETKRVPHSQQFVKSLLEPSISITSPTGVKFMDSKGGTSTPPRRASVVSATDDEDEDAAAIRKAKSLGLNESQLDTAVPGRHVQMILRGNWVQFNQEAEAGERTSRLYLLCSDLSVEASYAMEWVVGTMMRDGDTLLAIYAMEDEHGAKASEKATEAEREVLTAEGNKAGKDASDVMATLTRQTTQGGGTSLGLNKDAKYIPAAEAESLTGSVDARKLTKKEMDRLKAVEALKNDFLKLVRKTTLQVRCMVEVIHCKSPKHLILGAVCTPKFCVCALLTLCQIDELDPTLCVVGTRGRNSLKGVLLGSFSNYLVTKSSVPVMVARRRMKKPHSGPLISSSKIRLKNNLTASNFPMKRKSLTQARID